MLQISATRDGVSEIAIRCASDEDGVRLYRALLPVIGALNAALGTVWMVRHERQAAARIP